MTEICFFLRLVPFPVGNSSWKIFQGSGVSNILMSTIESRFHFDCIIQQPPWNSMQEISCHKTGLRNFQQWKMKIPPPFNSYILFLWLLWQTKWFMLLSSSACFEWNLAPFLNYIYINWHLLLGQNIPFPFFTNCRIRLVWGLSLIPLFHLFHLEEVLLSPSHLFEHVLALKFPNVLCILQPYIFI